MLDKEFYSIELKRVLSILKGNKDHTKEELDVVAFGMTIADMKNPNGFVACCRRNNLSLTDCMTLLTWVFMQKPFLEDIKADNDVTYNQACDFYERARVNTIVIHRLNWFLHESMLRVYNILDNEKRIRFNAKKFYGNAAKTWDKYLTDRRVQIERSAWFTLLDHLRLAYDAVSPYMEKVYESIRDYMIRLGYRDVEVKARIQVVLFMGKVAGHSFESFFEDFKHESRVDYSRCFENDDLRGMVNSFVQMCDSLGIKTEKDEYGYWMLKDLNVEDNIRFKWAWKDFISALRDDDLMDETAKNAIELNPSVQEEYQQILEEEEQKHISESVELLSEKFKVTRI